MKKAAIALLPMLSGCFLLGGGEESGVHKTPEELRREKPHVPPAFDLHLFGPAADARIGQWATYTVTKENEAQTLTLAVVGREGDKTWVEVVEEGEPRRVSARRVSPEGVVDLAYYREISSKGTSTAVFPQPISQYAAPNRAPGTVVSHDVKDAPVRVGEKSLEARVVKIDFEEFSGKVITEQTWWSKAAPPLYGASEEGGLVRKVAPGLTVDLVAFGEGAKPLVEIPK